MPHRPQIRGLLVAASATLAFAAIASPASAFELDVNYTCSFPTQSDLPVVVAFTPVSPPTADIGAKTAIFTSLSIRLDTGADVATALHRGNPTATTIEAENGSFGTDVTATGFALSPEGEFASAPVPIPASGSGPVLGGPVTYPDIVFPKVGPSVISVGADLTFEPVLRDAAGTVLRQPVTGTTDDPVTPTVDCVRIADGDNTLASVQLLTPRGTPTPSPVATATATPTPTPAPTPIVDPTPKPSPKPIAYSYGLTGSATLKTLTKGTLPLTGTADASLTLATGAFSADLALAPTSGSLVALGFLPVKANVAIVPQGPVTGVLNDSGLTANAKVRIKLPKVTLFGLGLAGGSGCQAKNVTNIALKSPGAFSPLDGGTLSGTFAISDLTNCGALTGIVSPLTAGSGNAIALKLTPKS